MIAKINLKRPRFFGGTELERGLPFQWWIEVRATVQSDGRDIDLNATKIGITVHCKIGDGNLDRSPRFLADGKRFSSERGLSRAEFVNLSWAKKVEMEAYQTEFTLTDDEMQVLRAFESELREPSGAATGDGTRVDGKGSVSRTTPD